MVSRAIYRTVKKILFKKPTKNIFFFSTNDLKTNIFMEYSNTALVGHQDRPQDTLGEPVAQVHQKKKY